MLFKSKLNRDTKWVFLAKVEVKYQLLYLINPFNSRKGGGLEEGKAIVWREAAEMSTLYLCQLILNLLKKYLRPGIQFTELENV